MALLNAGSNKKFYTRQDDETIVKMKNEGANNKAIAAVIGHSELSIAYRIQRVLAGKDSFDEIKYRAVAPAAPAPEETEEA